MTEKLLEMLSGGDLRSDGRADEVAEKVIAEPTLLVGLVEGLDNWDDVVRAKATPHPAG